MILERLGIYGMEAIEPALLAGLASGEPVLLVGGHGTAKTTLCRRLAAALGQRFWAYDASKALFEDIVGFPNPASLSAGAVDYVPTPLSIWDKEFVLIDELSRATPAMQNKWLEVIRSRTMMGRSIPELRTIFAAMNPPAYLGAQPLDEALAGRFATVISVPDLESMDRDTIERIMRNVTIDDGYAGVDTIDSELDLNALIRRIRHHAETLPEEIDDDLSRLVLTLTEELQRRKLPLDGRRVGMVYRILKIGTALFTALHGYDPAEACSDRDVLWRLLPFTVPWVATREEDDNLSVLGAAFQSSFAWKDRQPRMRLRYFRAPVKQVLAWVDTPEEEMDATEDAALVTRLLRQTGEHRSSPERSEAALALVLMARAVAVGARDVDIEQQYRLLQRFQELTVGWTASWKLFKFVGRNDVVDSEIEEPLDMFTSRLAFGLGNGKKNDDDDVLEQKLELQDICTRYQLETGGKI